MILDSLLHPCIGLLKVAKSFIDHPNAVWAFAQVKNFLAYKAKREGVPLIEVDARYSSQQCSRCAHTQRANRPNQETFRCCCCCFQSHADVNAAKVLEARVVFSTGPRFHV